MKKTMFSKELQRVFQGLEGVLIIKGEGSWVRFLREYGVIPSSLIGVFTAAYKVGGVQIMFAKNPKIAHTVITLN